MAYPLQPALKGPEYEMKKITKTMSTEAAIQMLYDNQTELTSIATAHQVMLFDVFRAFIDAEIAEQEILIKALESRSDSLKENPTAQSMFQQMIDQLKSLFIDKTGTEDNTVSHLKIVHRSDEPEQ
jgi:hypothetical protein